MSGIEKQPLRSVMGRLVALEKAYGMETTMAPGTSFLLPAIATKLIDVKPIYKQFVQERDNLDALWKAKAKTKTDQIGITEMFVRDFFKVLKITINRSVKLNNGQWATDDINFYNLDETGGNLPENLTEIEVLAWAEKITVGEANRILAKPTAPAMVNPSAAEVTAEAVVAQPLVAASSQAQAALADKRRDIDEANPEIDLLMDSVWSLVQIHYQKSPKETQREMLRNWGAIYAGVGEPNTLTVLVKDSAGAPLEGADMVLLETEGTATANPEGRVNLQTKVVGNITLRFSYPGKDDLDVPATIADDAEGTTIDLGTVTLVG